MRCVWIESPYNSSDPTVRSINYQYALCAMQDCLLRGEAPCASHLLYTQVPSMRCRKDSSLLIDHVICADDNDPLVRCVGRTAAIQAGLTIAQRFDVTVVYTDLGITEGMQLGIERAKQDGRLVEYRSLDMWKSPDHSSSIGTIS